VGVRVHVRENQEGEVAEEEAHRGYAAWSGRSIHQARVARGWRIEAIRWFGETERPPPIKPATFLASLRALVKR
jgi:hypothetical protein